MYPPTITISIATLPHSHPIGILFNQKTREMKLFGIGKKTLKIEKTASTDYRVTYGRKILYVGTREMCDLYAHSKSVELR